MTDPGDRSTARSNLDPQTGRPLNDPQAPAEGSGEEGARNVLHENELEQAELCLLYTSPNPRD